MAHNELLIMAGILVAGVTCQWLAWRIKIPAIIPLLAAGLLAGPVVLNVLHPSEQLGDLFFPFVSLSVAVILFEGALTLNWREVRNVATVVRNLLTIGALVTWLGAALAVRIFLDLPWVFGLLFGALIVVTGPTVIAPLLRNVRPTAGIASVLKWEGILIDALGALLAVLVFDYIVADSGGVEHTVVGFLRIVIIGSALGFGAGYLVHFLLSRYLIPDYLRDIAILAMVCGVFAIADAFAAESGLLAVTVMGVFLANTELKQVREIGYFKEKLSILLISTLFILLAANITPEALALLDWRSAAILLIVMFVLRPLGVQISAVGSPLDKRERLFLSWIAPRGIVAAAVSSLFVFELVRLGYEEAAVLGPVVFLVIVGTVLIQGATAKPFARWLGVSEAEPQGFLIMGGYHLARALGLALQAEGFAVRLIDTNWDNVTRARLEGLDSHHGNILSEATESDLDLSGIGRLLAMTRNDEANALACKHLEDEFGSSEVYQLAPRPAGVGQEPPSPFQLGRLLFASQATYDEIEKLMLEDAVVKKTKLTEQFTIADLRREYKDNVLPLMAIQGTQVIVATVDQPLEFGPGWTLVSLVQENQRTPDDPVQASNLTPASPAEIS